MCRVFFFECICLFGCVGLDVVVVFGCLILFFGYVLFGWCMLGIGLYLLVK